MAGKIARMRMLTRETGRAENAVTISFTAPIAFAETTASPRPVLTGHPNEIAADLRHYPALGVQNFNMVLPGRSISEQQAAMERFAREVMPLVP